MKAIVSSSWIGVDGGGGHFFPPWWKLNGFERSWWYFQEILCHRFSIIQNILRRPSKSNGNAKSNYNLQIIKNITLLSYFLLFSSTKSSFFIQTFFYLFAWHIIVDFKCQICFVLLFVISHLDIMWMWLYNIKKYLFLKFHRKKCEWKYFHP